MKYISILFIACMSFLAFAKPAPLAPQQSSEETQKPLKGQQSAHGSRSAASHRGRYGHGTHGRGLRGRGSQRMQGQHATGRHGHGYGGGFGQHKHGAKANTQAQPIDYSI